MSEANGTQPSCPIFLLCYEEACQLIADRIVPADWEDRRRILGVSAVAGLAMTAWDLVMDPVMVRRGHWVWEDDDRQGIPSMPSWDSARSSAASRRDTTLPALAGIVVIGILAAWSWVCGRGSALLRLTNGLELPRLPSSYVIFLIPPSPASRPRANSAPRSSRPALQRVVSQSRDPAPSRPLAASGIFLCARNGRK